jgi:hypothetical protein
MITVQQIASGTILGTCLLLAGTRPAASQPPLPTTITDYDENDMYIVRGQERLSYHGARESWVFNRAMVWVDQRDGLEGALLCYCSQSPLPLTGKKQVSRWYAGKANQVSDLDDQFTRFLKKDPKQAWDHACLPALQFQIEQNPIADLEVKEATHSWQFFVMVKGRSGPPLYASPWQTGPGKLTVNLLDLYRQKGYDHHFAEMNFFLASWTRNPQEAADVVFRLRLLGRETIVPSLPVIRTVQRVQSQGLPLCAVVLDDQARRLGSDAVEVTATVGPKQVRLNADNRGLWKAAVRDVSPGYHRAELRAVRRTDPRKTTVASLAIHVSDGQFVGYDTNLRLLTRGGKPLGPVTGSYRGQFVFRGVGTPQESLLHGQGQWQAAIADKQKPDYGFHWWESLTERELDADYAYLRQCGWSLLHLCSAWLWWERLDCGGRLAPFGAEQLAKVCKAADRHGLYLHLAVSHYPLGMRTPPYAQYLEAGYQRSDYSNPKSKFFRMFTDYLAQLGAVFRDETTLSSFTPAGEGDPPCGKDFVNMVYNGIHAHDGNHLVFAEPHHQITQDVNYYRKAGWKALVGGMRTYYIDRLPPEAIGAQFKLAAMGHIFMGEGCFYGFLGGVHQYMNVQMPIDSYRLRVRETIYVGLVARNPVLLTWEERIVEDERIVFEQVRRAVDWSKPFETPRVAIRVDAKLMPVAGRQPLFRYEKALSSFPLECQYVWEYQPAPPGTLATIDARKGFVEPSFVSEGGTLPDALRATMPLALPAGWVANYAWSQDHQTLLALLRKAQVGKRGETTEAGHFTMVDTTLAFLRDMLADTWEVECVKPGEIQLRIYRPTGHNLVQVGQSATVRMTRPGLNRFTLDPPIAVRQGDMIGCYIRDPNTHVAATHVGHMLFNEGDVNATRTRLSDWKTEPKTMHISVSRAADRVAAPKVHPAKPASGIVVQNFPAVELGYQLFDLAAKRAVVSGTFQKALTLEIPNKGEHFFLLVNPHTDVAVVGPAS